MSTAKRTTAEKETAMPPVIKQSSVRDEWAFNYVGPRDGLAGALEAHAVTFPIDATMPCYQAACAAIGVIKLCAAVEASDFVTARAVVSVYGPVVTCEMTFIARP